MATPASPWLDTTRFPGRRFLDSVGRTHGIAGTSTPAVTAEAELRRAWAAQLAVDPADLVPVATGADALRLVFQSLLAPGDTVLLAEPAPADALQAILATGARYVDVGRGAQGDVDAAGLHRALGWHASPVLFGQAPGLFGASDVPALGAQSRARAVVIDARMDARWAGPPLFGDRPLATVVALRDLADPRLGVAHAVVCATGTGAQLAGLRGAEALPVPLSRAALAVLQELAQSPARVVDAELAMQARYDEFTSLIRRMGRPGVTVLPRAGTVASAECAAGDAPEVGVSLACSGLPVVGGHGAWPMRNLVVIDLAPAAATAPSDYQDSHRV